MEAHEIDHVGTERTALASNGSASSLELVAQVDRSRHECLRHRRRCPGPGTALVEAPASAIFGAATVIGAAKVSMTDGTTVSALAGAATAIGAELRGPPWL